MKGYYYIYMLDMILTCFFFGFLNPHFYRCRIFLPFTLQKYKISHRSLFHIFTTTIAVLVARCIFYCSVRNRSLGTFKHEIFSKFQVSLGKTLERFLTNLRTSKEGGGGGQMNPHKILQHKNWTFEVIKIKLSVPVVQYWTHLSTLIGWRHLI